MKYRITAKITITVYTEVEADSESEAMEKAEQVDLMEIITDAYYTPDCFWVADELDGTPYDLMIDKDELL